MTRTTSSTITAFRIHFVDAERAPLDIVASSSNEARAIANGRGYTNGMIAKIKHLKQQDTKGEVA